MEKRALIVVDLQNEYRADGKLPLKNLDQTIANAKCVLTAARDRQGLIVHFRHETPGFADALFAAGTNGTEIIAAVAPVDGEAILSKRYPQVLPRHRTEEHVGRGEHHGCRDLWRGEPHVHRCNRACLIRFRTVVGDACATHARVSDGVDVLAPQVHARFMAALAFAYPKVVPTSVLFAD